jgi:hypothetical protein
MVTPVQPVPMTVVLLYAAMVHVHLVKIVLVAQRIVVNAVNVTMVMYLTALMMIAVQRLGLVMVYAMVKISSGVVTLPAMTGMVVTAQNHVKIIHAGMVPV